MFLLCILATVVGGTHLEQQFDTLQRSVPQIHGMFEKLRDNFSFMEDFKTFVEQSDLESTAFVLGHLMQNQIPVEVAIAFLTDEFFSKACPSFFTDLESAIFAGHVEPLRDRLLHEMRIVREAARDELTQLMTESYKREAEIRRLAVEYGLNRTPADYSNIHAIKKNLLPHLNRFVQLYRDGIGSNIGKGYLSPKCAMIVMIPKGSPQRAAITEQDRQKLENEFLESIKQYIDNVSESNPLDTLLTSIITQVGRIAQIYTHKIVWNVITKGMEAVKHKLDVFYVRPPACSEETIANSQKIQAMQAVELTESYKIRMLEFRIEELSIRLA